MTVNSEPGEPKPQAESQDKPKPPKSGGMKGTTKIVLGLVGLLVVLGIICCATGQLAPPKTSPASNQSNPPAPSWSPPTGYTHYGPGLAYKWEDSPTCSYGNRCGKLDVVAHNGCSSLYGEVSLIDSSGANVGYTNDLTQGVQPN